MVTTASDHQQVDHAKNLKKKLGRGITYGSSAPPEIIARVESHLVALKKKKRNRRHFKGAGTDLKIFTAVNHLTKSELLSDYEHVGVVQTPINPNDKTKVSRRIVC